MQLPPGRLPRDVADAASALGIQGVTDGVPLTGGISSDIWLVRPRTGPVVIKRALPRLRVAAEWRVPVERGRYEARWLAFAARVAPGCAPRLLGEAAGALALEYLPPETHRVWKSELAAGRADPAMAAAVGDRLGTLHSAAAAQPALADAFDSAALFNDLRLAPYLVATAIRHPDRADALAALAETTAATRRTLVHGDVSPKNILIGPSGPVLLDAECATWGDPAFDLAFCLTHLLLKTIWVPNATGGLLACFDALAAGYLPHVTWEGAGAVEARAARLLPGLLLARIDGKSPVEYITSETDRGRVRRVARALLAAPVDTLADIRAAWER